MICTFSGIKRGWNQVDKYMNRDYVVPISDKTYLELTHTYSQKLFSLFQCYWLYLTKKVFFIDTTFSRDDSIHSSF